MFARPVRKQSNLWDGRPLAERLDGLPKFWVCQHISAAVGDSCNACQPQPSPCCICVADPL